MSQYTEIVPSGYSPDGPHHDTLSRLAHLMMLRTSTTDERKHKRHFINISDETWRRWFGGASSKVKKAAKETGLIESNECYSAGRWSKGYHLAKQFSNGCFDTVVLKRKPRERKTTLGNVSEDAIGAKLHAKFVEFIPPTNVKPKNPWSKFSLNRLHAQDHYSTRCQYGRFHSNFTGLPKEMRMGLTIKTGEPLASIDATNIQPLLIGIIARQQHQRSSKLLLPICHTISEYISLGEAGQNYEFAQEKLKAGDVGSYDVTNWEEEEVFQVDPSKWSRDQVKKAFLICVFDTIEAMKLNPIYQVLVKYFPAVAQYIVQVKQGGHQELAKECQRLESKIMIDGVAGAMLKAFPESPILTIHDEIIVPVSRIGDVRQLIKAEFAKLGACPHVKETKFSKEVKQ